MYFNKLAPTVISAMFLLLILSSVNFSSVKLVNAATGDLVNYNNNFNMYTSPSDPNKDSAMQNANCVVNFMQTYVYAASSANNCNSAPIPAVPADQAQTPLQGQTPVQGQSYPAAPEGPQTGVSSQGESVGVVKVVDNNTNGGTFAPVQTTSVATNQNNADNDDDDNDKDARDKDNDDDNNNNDNDSETKVYNENTVTKQERKLLLTACFERAYDKGDYLSTKEIVKCAENYNS